MKQSDEEARRVSKLLDDQNLQRATFNTLFAQWKEQPFDWRVHLGLIMSPTINREEFLYLARRYTSHTMMKEEVLAQIRRFNIQKAECEALLTDFLPEEERRSFSHAQSWSILERVAMSRL